MRKFHGILGAFTALVLATPLSASAQVPGAAVIDPPGSDRAGKRLAADAPPPEPSPAPGTRYAKDAAIPAPGSRLGADAADAVETRRNLAAAPGVVPPPVIGSHQIDRYDAIEKERQVLADNPKSLADWIILGELSHEVAMDAPADLAGKYFKMSSDAFASALALAPNNAGLKAAVQFARDQQTNADSFEKSRDQYTDTFLDARRRDLGATGNTPYVKMYEPPLPNRTLPGPATTPSTSARPAPPATPASAAAAVKATSDRAVDSAVPLVKSRDVPVAEAVPAVTPARTDAPATDGANYGTQQNYSAGSTYAAPLIYAGQSYRPFVNPAGTPYTYQQYTTGYFPTGVYTNPAVAPVSLQRLGVPGAAVAPAAPVVPNALERQILNRATTPATAPLP